MHIYPRNSNKRGQRALACFCFHSGTKFIAEDAFYCCYNFTRITIPSNVVSIGTNAFLGCDALTNVTVPNSVTSIGDSPFDTWTNLKYNEYGNGCYLGNSSNPYLILVKVKWTAVTSFEIHEKTRFVHGNAFDNCSNLNSLVIPNSVRSIGEWATYDCDNLSAVYYSGSEKSWNQVSIAQFNMIDYATIYYYSDAEPTDTDYPYWHYVDGVPTKW